MPKPSNLPRGGGSKRTSSDEGVKQDNARSDVDLLFQLFTEIGIIDQLANAAFEKVLPHGLTGAQFAILNHFVRTGDNETPAQVAEVMQVSRATLTSTLRRLESKGFIRIVADANDGRCKRILLTAAGRRARESSIQLAGPLLNSVRTALPRADVLRWLPALQRLREWLDRNRG